MKLTASELNENIEKNRIYAEKVRKQRDFEATAIPWKKYKKIKRFESVKDVILRIQCG